MDSRRNDTDFILIDYKLLITLPLNGKKIVIVSLKITYL